jgi:hypothetical protein
MIRIDEIYNHTFWPFIQKNLPRTRMWYCDPPGYSGVEYLNIHDTPGEDFYYVFLFDQEPINFRRMQPMTQYIYTNQNNTLRSPGRGAIVTSEFNSSTVDRICQLYDWDSYYYFFNGWAALDWFRGYDKTFITTPIQERKIKHTFISPNRIISGERHHRLLLLYHLFKQGLGHNLISCPEKCPAGDIHTIDVARSLEHIYSDIVKVFQQAQLPMHLDRDAPSYASATLDLHDESAECLLYLVTETVGSGQRLHLTEKIFKPICMQMPFVLASTKGSLAYLRSYGFKTFGDIWDESYDNEPDDRLRIVKIAELLRWLEDQGTRRQDIFAQCQDIILHNFQHFYNGGFEKILWHELQGMLNDMRIKFSI